MHQVYSFISGTVRFSHAPTVAMQLIVHGETLLVNKTTQHKIP